MTDRWGGVAAASEHRTTGQRAWCFQDRTWCYPSVYCPCCLEASEDYEICSACDGEGYVRLVPADPEVER